MKKKLLLLCAIVIAMFTCGCNNDTLTTHNIGKEINKDDSSELELSEDDTKETENSGKRSITIGFVNELSAEIGMISLLDPATDEQVNIDGLSDGEMIVLDYNIPEGVNDLKWAIYNNDGELYSSSTTDVTEVKESVYIILSGNGELEDVKTVFDKSEDEVKAVINSEDKSQGGE